MMNKENFFALLMLAIIGASFYFFYLVFSPYAVPIGWAVVLTLVFYPAYERLKRWLKNRRSLASLVATILTAWPYWTSIPPNWRRKRIDSPCQGMAENERMLSRLWQVFA